MSDNIQEAEVGSGTKISDTKQSEKRAQITLKAIQLRLKQEKERAALQQQKKSLQVKEDIGVGKCTYTLNLIRNFIFIFPSCVTSCPLPATCLVGD